MRRNLPKSQDAPMRPLPPPILPPPGAKRKLPKEARAPVRKRPRTVVRREYQAPVYGYAQEGNGGYRQEWSGGVFPPGGGQGFDFCPSAPPRHHWGKNLIGGAGREGARAAAVVPAPVRA